MSGHPLTHPSGATQVPDNALHVSVMTPLGLGGKGGIDRQMDALNTVLRARAVPGLEVSFHKTRGEGPLIFSAGLMAMLAVQLAARKLAGKVDVVHINLAHSGSVYRKVALGGICRLLGIPYVVHLHGSRFRQSWNAAPAWLSRAIRNYFEYSAATLVLGKVWAEFVARKAPGVADRIVIAPSSSHAHAGTREPAQRAVKNILFLGRLGARKGVPQLVAALRLLDAEKNWRADLAGDGEIAQTRQAIAAAGLEARVAVPGWVGGAAHDLLFDNADILVLPSLDENLPMTIVEAFSRGVAVISTPVGAIGDIVIDGETGLLVEPGNAEQLAAALGRLLDDDGLRARLAEGGRRMFEARLDIEGYADRMLDIWRRAAKTGGRRLALRASATTNAAPAPPRHPE